MSHADTKTLSEIVEKCSSLDKRKIGEFSDSEALSFLEDLHRMVYEELLEQKMQYAKKHEEFVDF